MLNILTASNIITVLVIFLVGLFAPHITRKEIIFGVRVPEAFRDHDDVKRTKKKYTRNYLLMAGLPSILFIVFHLMWDAHITIIFSMLILIALIYMNYYFCHKSLRKSKNENNWYQGYRETSVTDTSFKPGKSLVSPWWFCIPLGLILIQVLITIYQYDSLPDVIATHFDTSGKPDGWKEKSYRFLLMMPAMEILTTIAMFLAYKTIGWTKQKLSAEAPEESRIKNMIIRKRLSALMIILSVVVISSILPIHLFILQVLKIKFELLLLFIIILEPMFLLMAACVLVFKTSEGGSLFDLIDKPKANKDKTDRDDDKYWKGGIIYYNPDDPAVFVEKRFGIGTTVNFGNKKAILSIIGFFIIFPVLCYFLSFIGHN